MATYRVDELSPQQSIIYITDVATVVATADVVIFQDSAGKTIAIAPEPSRIAYVQV